MKIAPLVVIAYVEAGVINRAHVRWRHPVHEAALGTQEPSLSLGDVHGQRSGMVWCGVVWTCCCTWGRARFVPGHPLFQAQQWRWLFVKAGDGERSSSPALHEAKHVHHYARHAIAITNFRHVLSVRCNALFDRACASVAKLFKPVRHNDRATCLTIGGGVAEPLAWMGYFICKKGFQATGIHDGKTTLNRGHVAHRSTSA